MERVKDISRIKLCAGYVLLKIRLRTTMLITLNSKDKSGPQVEYAEVVAFGPTVEDVKIGDVALDFKSNEGFEWRGDNYALVARMNIKVLIEKDNFDFSHGKKAKDELKN